MRFVSFREWFRRMSPPAARVPQPERSRRRLRLERLEDRSLLSVSSAFSGVPFLRVGTDVNASRLPGNQNEVTVAVNPANPANWIAFSNDSNGAAGGDPAWFSRDAGRTWALSVIANPVGQRDAG